MEITTDKLYKFNSKLFQDIFYSSLSTNKLNQYTRTILSDDLMTTFQIEIDIV